MEDNIKRRGRPKKIKLSDDERLEELLFKAYCISVNADGSLRFERNGAPLTLDETAFMVWNIEGRKTKKPLTSMAMLKTEQSALAKIRKGLARYGINDFNDVFDSRYRTAATAKFGCTDSPE